MLTKTFFIVAMMICLTILSGCGITRKWQIESELEQLKPQQELSQQRLDGSKQKISSLQNQSNGFLEKIQTRESQTMAYLRQHTAALSCAIAKGYSFGDKNYFSEKTNELIGYYTAGCVVYELFDEEFSTEIGNVVTEIRKANTDIANYQSQLTTIKPKIDAETRARKSEEGVLNELSQKIQTLELELDKLK